MCPQFLKWTSKLAGSLPSQGKEQQFSTALAHRWKVRSQANLSTLLQPPPARSVSVRRLCWTPQGCPLPSQEWKKISHAHSSDFSWCWKKIGHTKMAWQRWLKQQRSYSTVHKEKRNRCACMHVMHLFLINSRRLTKAISYMATKYCRSWRCAPKEKWEPELVLCKLRAKSHKDSATLAKCPQKKMEHLSPLFHRDDLSLEGHISKA